MCQTWAKFLRSMCHPTFLTCLASQMTSRTVLTWALASPPLLLVPFQSCPPFTQGWLSLSSQVSWDLDWSWARNHVLSPSPSTHTFLLCSQT